MGARAWAPSSRSPTRSSPCSPRGSTRSPPSAKSILADAAVIGKVFWAGAVAAMGDRTRAPTSRPALRRARTQGARPARPGDRRWRARRSTPSGTSSPATSPMPAPSRVPRLAPRRGRRVDRGEGRRPCRGPRPDPRPPLLHRARPRAGGRTIDQAAELESAGPPVPDARRGTRARSRHRRGARAFERALALTPPDHSARADALRRFGEVAYQAARFSEAAVALEEAFELFRARGDQAAAVVLITLRWSYDALNDPRRFDLRREALALLEGFPPGPPLIRALADAAGYAIINEGEIAEGRALADRALTIAQELGLPIPHGALGFRAMARVYEGDAGCLEDYRDALTLAKEVGDGQSAGSFTTTSGWRCWTTKVPEVRSTWSARASDSRRREGCAVRCSFLRRAKSICS